MLMLHSTCRFYGINLNQNFVLQQIGFDGSTGSPWNRLFKISTGGLIITALGFVPGEWEDTFLFSCPKLQVGNADA